MTSIENRRVRGDGGSREGALIYVDEVLHAVFSRLNEEDALSGHPAGTWFLESGLGPCGVLYHAEEQIFGTIEEAAAWVGREAASD